MTIKKKIHVLIFTFAFIVGIFFSVYYYQNSTKYYINKNINITDNSNIDYNVYLQENNYFTEKFLPKDSVYISSLIDYLDVFLNYNVSFDENMSGSYTYYIKGVVSADLQNSSNKYWSKEYILSDPITEELIDKSYINIDKNIQIDYQYYNSLLTDFKKEYGLNFDGKFTLYLCVSSNFENKYNEVNLKDESYISLEIPLTIATIEVPIEINNSRTNNIMELGMIYLDNKLYKTNLVLCVISIFSSIMYLCVIISILRENQQNLKEYEKEVKKILKTYNGIVVNIKNKPDLTKRKVNVVDKFEELLDAHSEVRMPINFYEDDKISEFILDNSDIAWQYVINKRGKNEKKK